MQKNYHLQEHFLTKLQRSRVSVTIFLVNGYQLRGVVHGFDAFIVVLYTEGRQQVIYKHAISTIVPERPVELREATAVEGEAPFQSIPRG